MAALERGDRQSTLVSEMRWAAHMRGTAARQFLCDYLGLVRLLLPRPRER
jgi:hypothetical protein